MCEIKQYALRTYGDENAELTDYDKKFVKSLKNFKKTYETEISKRKCIVFLKERHTTSLFQESNIKKNINKTAEVKENNEVKETNEVIYCTATKMNGEKCTSKAKPGCNVCGRHKKKTN